MPSTTRQSLLSFSVKKHITNASSKTSPCEISKRPIDNNETSSSECKVPIQIFRNKHDKTPVSNERTKVDTPISGKLSSARKAFHSSATGLVCREQEISELEGFLFDHLKNETSASMYISGLPGTGKTASLLQVLENEKIIKGFHKVYINCTAIQSAGAIYQRICEELKIRTSGKTEKAALNAIEKYLPMKHKMVLMVLDEVDQLESRFQSVLYRMFEWPAGKNPRLVLVGVANAVDLTDRMLPRLCSSITLKPVLLHFRPYTKDQIVTILRHRLAESEGLVFAPGALELISAKVAVQSGDLRRALDLARRVIDVTQTPPTTTAPHTPARPKSMKRLTFANTSPTKRTYDSSQSPLKDSGDFTPRKSPRKSIAREISRRDFVDPEAHSPKRTERTPIKRKIDGTPVCTPRKSLFGTEDVKSTSRAVLAENSPRKTPGQTPRKSPRKALIDKENETGSLVSRKSRGNTLASVRKSPRKLSIDGGDETGSATPRKSVRKLSIARDNENVSLTPRKSPRKLSIDRDNENVSLTPRKSSRKLSIDRDNETVSSTPRKSPRKLSIDRDNDDVSLTPRKSPRKLSISDNFSIRAQDVARVVNQTYGSGRNVADHAAFPLHQKILICSLLLILKKGKNKDVSVGKLHEVYGRVCVKRGITPVDQSGFIFLSRQVEMTGALLVGKGPARLAKISLQWDEDEISHAIQDSGLLAAIINDTNCLSKNKA